VPVMRKASAPPFVQTRRVMTSRTSSETSGVRWSGPRSSAVAHAAGDHATDATVRARLLRSLAAVVKAGAYGHGLEEIAKSLAATGIAFFGVANVGEARRIRNAGVQTRIYLLGATWSGEREEIVARDWTPCISSLDEAEHFNRLAAIRGTRLKVHLAVDTGMGRGGFVADHLPEKLVLLERMENLEIEGVGSHLPSADEDVEFTLRQFERFHAIIRELGGASRFRWIHLSNSAGLLGYNQGACNLSRPGLMLYGVSPLPGFQERLATVMTLKSRVTLLRSLPAGHGVSYGRQFVTTRPTRVATVGIGYGLVTFNPEGGDVLTLYNPEKAVLTCTPR